MTDNTESELGMSWWNGLTDHERAEWMRRAGNSGRAADAWAVFKQTSLTTEGCNEAHKNYAHQQ